MDTLLKSIERSRLKVTAFENNKNNIDKVSINKSGEKLEFSLLMYEINVLTFELSRQKL